MMARDLIVFGEDWGGLPSSTQHLIRHLADNRKVLWINSIGLRQPRLKMADIKRLWSKIYLAKKTASESRDIIPSGNFRILQPLTLPAPRSSVARWLARTLLKHQVLCAMKRQQMYQPILWTSLPTASDMVGYLGEKATVYYCGDDFSALAGVDHETVARRELELMHKADLIITASETLQQRFPSRSTRLLTHGVDYRLFTTPTLKAVDFPGNGKPVAGFYGSISEWLDIGLMQRVIEAMPHWHFLFIGNSVVNVSSLSRLGNVTFLGARKHHELPSYSQHWQASLLPFVGNAQIQSCNPLKLSEYLATGRPIISTPFPALNAYRDLVSVVENAADMIRALQRLDSTKPSVTSHVMQSRVESHSWQQRAALAEHWLEQL